MILHRHDAILRAGRPPATDRAAQSLHDVAVWLAASVSRPSVELGRSGEVCPWTRRASERGTLLLGVCGERDERRIDVAIVGLMRQFMADGRATALSGMARAIIAVFAEQGPEAEARVVATHARLKPLHLACGLMLGEFFPSCEKPGLHNADFRPLRSPWPLLVIRPMVEGDIEFLLDEDCFARAYLTQYGMRGAVRLEQVLAAREAQLEPERVDALKKLIR